MKHPALLATMAILLTWPQAVGAVESPNFRLIQEQIVSGFGAIESSRFTESRGLVGLSGAGRATSESFVLRLGEKEAVRPPGGTGRPIDVRGTIDDDDATVVVSALNEVTATVSQGTWLAQAVQLAEGPNTITATATDLAGNAATKQIRVFVDTIPPARPTLKPVISPTMQSPQTLSGTKETETSIWLNGQEVVPLDDRTTWMYRVMLLQGKNAIDLWAHDRARNASTHVKGHIIYDLTPPKVPVVTDDGEFTTSTTELHARWQAEEDATEIVNYAYAIGTRAGGTDVVPFTDVGTKTEITRTGLTLQEGVKYYFTVRATNAVGLVSEPGSSDGIRVNTKPPTITAVNPADGSAYYPPAVVTCRITATDPSGDPLEYRFLVNDQVVRDWSPVETYSLDTRAFPSGLKTLQMEARDPYDGVDRRKVQIYLFRKPLGAKE